MAKAGGMSSLTELYRIGRGPSASHTMGPHSAATQFRAKYPNASRFRVILHGSLASTGRGHMTDVAICDALSPVAVELVWWPGKPLSLHPNGMTFEALKADGSLQGIWRGYSPGGGAVWNEAGAQQDSEPTYPLTSMAEALDWSVRNEEPLWRLVDKYEGQAIWEHLRTAWRTMQAAMERGLKTTGTLPGELNLPRKAATHLVNAERSRRRTSLLSAYALAVSEENAAAGVVCTAPTCGSCGTMPSVLRYVSEAVDSSERDIIRALAVGGIVGNLIKTNASISGAEIGCQGEVGAACAMAAGAAAFLLGATSKQIEYAAEMALEHHLGMTCDPVLGMVQIPCIERNAVAAMRALDSAEYAMCGDGTHTVSFDQVVAAMKQTGHDMPSLYRETAEGGLARFVQIKTP